MLTADLVRAYRRGGELRLRPLSGAARERALVLAGRYLAIAGACVGSTRGDLDEACAAVPVAAQDRKIADGLRKLVVDRCQFEVEPGCDPIELRCEVFARAGALRRALEPGQRFDRDALLAGIAAARGLTPAELERLLYVDLRSAHRLLSFRATPAEALVADYVTGQAQAVLLRAVRVRARVQCRAPLVYRDLFRKLKFLRLLHRIEEAPARDPDSGPISGPEGGYVIDIDGPYSMFRSVTKYGLQLALLLPSLQACDHWAIEAEVHWGKQRTPLAFFLEGRAGSPGPRAGRGKRAAGGEAAAAAGGEIAPGQLPDEVIALVERFQAMDGPWRPRPAADILSLPGAGLCVPDLVFEHAQTGVQVYLEVLGFWSREAVWRRVELVQKGLPHRILFAVSSRLRVSEAALDQDLPGALYVYKGTMSARAVAGHLDRLGA